MTSSQPDKLLFWGPIILMLACSHVCAQDEYPSLSIPGLDSGTPADAATEGERQFYGSPGSDRLPRNEDSFPAETRQPPSAGDFSITIRTELLSPFVDDQRIESNNVATRVLEADVRGVQTTATNIRLQSAASSDMARLNVVTQGTVNSNTVGYTPQARVTTAGNHTFNVTKPIYFDGNRFLTKPAYGGLQVRQTPQAVNSIASGVPLFGQLGDQIAWNEVLRRMPASDSIIARQVADDVFPKVNSSVEEKIRNLNLRWRDLRLQLKTIWGNDSVVWKANSSADSFSTVATNQSVSRGYSITASRNLQSSLAEIEVAAIVVSEDSTNHLLNKLPINGMTVTDATLQKLVQEFQQGEKNPRRIPTMLQNIDQWKADPLLFSLKFADESPVSLLFRDGSLQIEVRFQVLPKAGSPSLMQRMTIHLSGKSTGNSEWSLFVRGIDVVPASSNEQPDTWTNLISNQAKTMTSVIPPSNLPRKIDLRRYDPRLPVLLIHRIQSIGGQLRISFKRDESEQVSARKIPW